MKKITILLTVILLGCTKTEVIETVFIIKRGPVIKIESMDNVTL
jgi:hypothetical protein